MAHNFSSVEAGKAENRELNRYRDVYPYDHSRVTIRDLSATDYINASLVKVKKQRGRIGGRGRFPGLASQINLVIDLYQGEPIPIDKFGLNRCQWIQIF